MEYSEFAWPLLEHLVYNLFPAVYQGLVVSMPRQVAVVLQVILLLGRWSFGSSMYIQTVSNPNETTSQLLCNKSHMTPMKVVTIPRLELSACLFIAKLTHKILVAQKLQKTFVDRATECLKFSSYPRIFSGYMSHLRAIQPIWFLDIWMWEHSWQVIFGDEGHTFQCSVFHLQKQYRILTIWQTNCT